MITPKALAKFSDALDALCNDHGVILVHEDSHGVALVLDVAEYPDGDEGECWIPLRAAPRGRR